MGKCFWKGYHWKEQPFGYWRDPQHLQFVLQGFKVPYTIELEKGFIEKRVCEFWFEEEEEQPLNEDLVSWARSVFEDNLWEIRQSIDEEAELRIHQYQVEQDDYYWSLLENFDHSIY